MKQPVPHETAGPPRPPGPHAPAGRTAKGLEAWRLRFRCVIPAMLVFGGFGVLQGDAPRASPLSVFVSVVWTLPLGIALLGFAGARTAARTARTAPAGTADPGARIGDLLVVVVPTIGRSDVYPALERSVLSYCAHLPASFGQFRVDIVIEQDCQTRDAIRALAQACPQVRVVEVPRAYRTPAGTRFKARANHFAHEQRIADGEDRVDVWVLHMDDDTGIGPDTATALAGFIAVQDRVAAAGGPVKHLAQGVLAFPREHARSRFTWLADALRPSDDLSRFCLMTGSGTPRAGLHGELLLIRGSCEAEIGWDFGPDTIVEDSQFALHFMARFPGASGWFLGRSYGASPAGVGDFLRQRERWAWGLVGLALDRGYPLRHRAFIGYGLACSVLGPLQHVFTLQLFAWLLQDTIRPPYWGIAFLWSVSMTYQVWLYWEGLRVNAGVSRHARRHWYEAAAVVVLLPVFGLLEGLGCLRGFLKYLADEQKTFTVIPKPA